MSGAARIQRKLAAAKAVVRRVLAAVADCGGDAVGQLFTPYFIRRHVYRSLRVDLSQQYLRRRFTAAPGGMYDVSPPTLQQITEAVWEERRTRGLYMAAPNGMDLTEKREWEKAVGWLDRLLAAIPDRMDA